MFRPDPIQWFKPTVMMGYEIAVLSIAAAAIISPLPAFYLRATGSHYHLVLATKVEAPA